MTNASYHDQPSEATVERYRAFVLDLDLLLQHYGFLDDPTLAHPKLQKAVEYSAAAIHETIDAFYADAKRPVRGIVPFPDEIEEDAFGAAGDDPEPVKEPAVVTSALEMASQIARSAAGTSIDWSVEPLTEREARIRSRWLARQMEDDDTRWALTDRAFRMRSAGETIANDLAATVAEIKLFDGLQRQQDEEDEYRDVADEIDEQV